MQQVAVSPVNLDEIETSRIGALCRIGKRTNNTGNLSLLERLGDRLAFRKSDCARSYGLPPAFLRSQQTLAAKGYRHAGLASGVGKLDARARALGVNEADDLSELVDVLVFPDPQVADGDTAFGRYRRSFEHHQSRATLRTRAEVNEMPVIREPVY